MVTREERDTRQLFADRYGEDRTGVVRRIEQAVIGGELLLAVNHLAPFLLTTLLVERLLTSGGRVVTTSSVGHKRVESIDLDDLQLEGRYRSLHSYGRSKLANILFTSELTQRTGLAATCFNPGSVKTDILRDRSPVTRLLTLIATSPERGADTLVWLATSAEGGAPAAVYYQHRKPAKSSAAARSTPSLPLASGTGPSS